MSPAPSPHERAATAPRRFAIWRGPGRIWGVTISSRASQRPPVSKRARIVRTVILDSALVAALLWTLIRMTQARQLDAPTLLSLLALAASIAYAQWVSLRGRVRG